MGHNIIGRSGAIHCEDKHYPVVIGTFFGVATEPVVTEYFQWLTSQSNRLNGVDDRLVNVSDLGMASVPDAATRRIVADQTNTWSATLPNTRCVYAVAVVESVLIKGVLQTLAWLQGNMQLQYVTSRKDAMTEAIRYLRAHRIATSHLNESVALTRPPRPEFG